jgi:hypothetical protein
VTQILTRERGLTNFWNYGQAVKQLAGEPPEPDPRGALARRIGFTRASHGD